jgi:hypothetical protein
MHIRGTGSTILYENLKIIYQLQELGIDGKIILKYILQKEGG